MSCPEKDCGKKLNKELGKDELFCEKCSKYISKPNPMYNLSTSITDGTHTFYANAFKAGESIMGVNP